MIYHTVEETVGGVFVLVVGAVAHVVAQLILADAAPLVVAVRRRTEEPLGALLHFRTFCKNIKKSLFSENFDLQLILEEDLCICFRNDPRK